MKTYGGVKLHAFLTLTLHGDEWTASCSRSFIAGEGALRAHWTGVWEGVSCRSVYRQCRGEKILDPIGNRTPAVKLVATHYAKIIIMTPILHVLVKRKLKTGTVLKTLYKVQCNRSKILNLCL
jgi:hypothetical protein